MKSLRVLGILLCILGFAKLACAAPPKIVFVRCGKLIYDTEKPPITNAGVVITDGKITAVGADVTPPAGAQQIDLSQYTVLPGLIDAHTHLWTGPFGATPSAGLGLLRATKAVDYALRSGIVAMRILGSDNFIDVALHDAIDEGTIPGPHIVPCGHAISIIGGHGDFLNMPVQFPLADYYTPLNGFINSPDDAEKAVHLQIKYGAKVIKVLASGGVLSPLDSPTAEQVSPEELRVIVEQAHMDHLKVAAHDENLTTILAALHAGVDSIEHGSDLNQEAIDYMNAHHITLVPTVYIVDNIMTNGAKMHMPPWVLRKANELGTKHLASFKMALRNNVFMAAGSDQVYQPGKGTVRDEVITEVKFGMTPGQALTAATKHGAQLLGLDDLGTVAVGKEGDLVAVQGDPMSDIHVLDNVKAVVYQGVTLSPMNHTAQ
ncbi:MAG TPA: amidohydrolase family protein [Candidatus Acidoferrales bacterium]|nr:amidohydrolase family protein [Candidatus Acidoferrales bacterium]